MKVKNLQPAVTTEQKIAALITTLHETERLLEELTGGEVDTVSDQFGRPYMLRRAQEEQRKRIADKQAALLNALPAHIALLNTDGAIITVNETWVQFATANNLQGSAPGIGLNYLEVCDRVCGPEKPDALQSAAGIRAVLAGKGSFTMEYACHSPTEQRWFMMVVTPMSRDGPHGAVVMHLNITQRRIAEDALRMNKNRLRDLIDGLGTSMMVGLMTPDGILIEANSAALAAMGLKSQEVIGKPFVDCPWFAYSTEVKQQLHDAIARSARGEASRYDMKMRGVDGLMDIDFVLNPVRDESGKIAFLVPSGNVITDRKRAETAMRESNEKFHLLADNIGDAFWIRSPDFSEVQYLSPAFETIWGRSVDSLKANPQKWAEFIFAEDHLRVLDAFASLCAESPHLDIEYRIVRPDGAVRWVRVRGSQIRNETDQLIRHIGIVTDITEHRQSREALEESQRLFKALFEQAAVGVAMVEALTGRFVQVNQRLADILGRSRSEVEELTFFAITHLQDMASVSENMQLLITGSIREYVREKRYLRKDGSEVWVNFTVSAMWAPGEAPSLCIAVVQDITERKRLDAHFLQSQRLEALGQFSGGVAHDFNNILAAISGYTELSGMLLKGNPEVRDHLESVLKASGRATDLVKQILTFSRQQPQDRHVIKLQSVLKESIKFLRASIPATISFDISIAADAPTVLGNANQIHQILTNLGINSLHAMSDEPGELQITLEKWQVDEAQAAGQPRLRPGSYARLSIRDTGCGMDTDTLRRIFEPFFTTKPVGQGTGLGLSVVHGIMDAHDGAVTVYSQPGQGTCFHLYFPAQAGDIKVDEGALGPTPRGKGEAVLIVDDEEMIASMLQEALNHLGYAAEATTEPEAALVLVQANPSHFKMVLSDLTMPGMTGLGLASRLQEIRQDLPVLLMTGLNASLTRERLEAAGVRQVLIKPISVHVLGTTLHAVLAGQSH